MYRGAAVLLWALILYLVSLVNTAIPNPYMDEIFHAGQTRSWCSNQWSRWDPSLTTPPGSYVLPLALGICQDVRSMRIINTIWFLACSLCIIALIGCKCSRPPLKMLEIMSHPLILFHSLLYYTDIPSLTMCLATILAVRRDHLKFAAVLGTFSIVFRQTNIIWLMFACMEELVSLYGQSDKFLEFAKTCLVHTRLILGRFLPIIGVGLAATLAALLNGSIVLGDKTNHIARFHAVQVPYFALFACLARWALPCRVPSILSSCAAAPFLAFLIQKTTFAHPFILSDNRHYVFYIWKNFFGRFHFFRFALIPVYIASFSTLADLFQKSAKPCLWQATFWLCTAIVLIPSPLIDGRYFIVPFVLLSIEDTSVDDRRRVGNFAMNMVVNAVTIYVFLYRPYSWADGSTARFMW